MAAIVIDYLCRLTRSDDIGIAYLFCNNRLEADQNATNLLAALLKQLGQNRQNIWAVVTRKYDRHSKRKSRPSLGEIIEAQQSVCSNYTTVYIVVDALDECVDGDRLIDELLKIQAVMDVRLLFTSRFVPKIMRSHPVLEVRASKEDMSRFVIGQIPNLSNCIQRDEELKQTVLNKIVEAIDGM